MRGKFSRAAAYKFQQMSAGDEAQKRIDEAYITAFHKGYSVVEICRVGGMKSAKHVHAALVKHGEIPRGKPGRQAAGIVIPESLAEVLKIRELSFSQWCAGWSFDLGDAVKEIGSRMGAAVEAIRRDFPKCYRELTGANQIEELFEIPEFERYDFTVKFDYDGGEACYTAAIPEMEIHTFGDSYQSAFYLALLQRNREIEISRLEKLPDLSDAVGF